jgi:hypothetical protein
MKEVGRIWQTIGREDLQHFEKQSREDLKRFKDEHEKFITQINNLRAGAGLNKEDKENQAPEVPSQNQERSNKKSHKKLLSKRKKRTDESQEEEKMPKPKRPELK